MCMKKFVFIFIFILLACMMFAPSMRPTKISHAGSDAKPMLALVIDDFGGYDRSGVETMLSIGAPLTCAVMPLCENSKEDATRAKEHGHEVILHMPMEAHIKLPDNWYGNICIRNYDNEENVTKKLDTAIESMGEVKGANIHIGSGVSRNPRLMKAIYDYMKRKNMFFLDSRTIVSNVCEEYCASNHMAYLGRDVFLEADKNKSYGAVLRNLQEACDKAKEQGYSVAIGHVGAEGGENTARAIRDMLPKIQEMGIEIVPLSKIYERINTTKNI